MLSVKCGAVYREYPTRGNPSSYQSSASSLDSPFRRAAKSNNDAARAPMSTVFNFSTSHAPSPGPSQAHVVRKPAKPLPALLPATIRMGNRPLVTITRRRAERGLMTGSVLLAVWRLYHDMGAKTEAIGARIELWESGCALTPFSQELSLLSGLVTVYLGMRGTKVTGNSASRLSNHPHLAVNSDVLSAAVPLPNGGISKEDGTPTDPSGIHMPVARNRKQHDHFSTGRNSPNPGSSASRHEHGVNRQTTLSDTEDSSIGSRGLVWATSDRNYRQVRLLWAGIFCLPLL